MKIETFVKEISHEELVNLFSTALLGNYRWGIDYDDEDCDEDTAEDTIASLLLRDRVVYVYDNDAEGEVYGKNAVIQKDGSAKYSLTLSDIIAGVENIFNSKEYDLMETAIEWINPDGMLDVIGADNILQYILFNEIIYG